MIRETGSEHTIEDIEIFIKGRTADDIRNRLLVNKIDRASSEKFFENEFNVSTADWNSIYTLPFCSTVENKTRAFQFKVNHNIFYHNQKLFDLKMIDSPKCTFCNEENETLSHLFLNCKHVKPLWNQISKQMQSSVHEYEQLNDVNKLLGFFNQLNDKKYLVWSLITILVKYYIHICRLNEKVPLPSVMLKRIDYVETLELKIAERNKRSIKHFKKWEPYLLGR